MEPGAQRSRRGTARRLPLPSRNAFRLGAALISLLLLVLFVLENARTVPVRFLVFEVDTWLAWALVVAAVLGFLVGLAWPWFRRLW
jgi:uncharacterized integral membrane protein